MLCVFVVVLVVVWFACCLGWFVRLLGYSAVVLFAGFVIRVFNLCYFAFGFDFVLCILLCWFDGLVLWLCLV